MFAAPLRPLWREDCLAPEDKGVCGAFIGERLQTSPDGKAGVVFSDKVLPPRQRRRNGSETPRETLPSKGLDKDDRVPTGGHPSVPIFKRIGGPREPGRSLTRSSLHVPAGCRAPGGPEQTPPVVFRRRAREAESGEDTSEKTPGGLSPPVPKPRGKKRLSGSFSDACPPPESGSVGSERSGPPSPPVPLPRTKKRLSWPPPEGPGVPAQGELSSPAELEKQVLAAMAEDFPEKVADQVSESWADEKDPISGTRTGAAKDDWLHVGGGDDKETKEEELDFGFVCVGGASGSGPVQR